MIGKMLTMGFDLATLPARMTFRGARAMVITPGDFNGLLAELRQASDEVAREIELVLSSVDAEMSQKTAHLNPEQKQQAAGLALDAAEQHLSMAAVNMLRALWLAMDSSKKLGQDRDPVIIDQVD